MSLFTTRHYMVKQSTRLNTKEETNLKAVAPHTMIHIGLVNRIKHANFVAVRIQ